MSKFDLTGLFFMASAARNAGVRQVNVDPANVEDLVRALRNEQRLRAYWTKVAFACAAYAVFVGVVL